jgi:hypothetical protein
MQQITSYLYDNVVLVQFDLDPEIKQRNRVVYTKPLQIYKGIDNVLKVKVLNSDQKPVNVAAYTMTFNIVDDYVFTNANTVLSSNITVVNASIGLGTVTISQLDMVQLDRERYTFNVKINDGSANVAAYVDDNYGAAGQVIVSSVAYPVPPPANLDLGLVSDGVTSAIFDFGNI